MISKPQTLRLPNASAGGAKSVDVPHRGQVVIVGANGSGKSRLGAWLENPASLRPNRGAIRGGGGRQAYRLGAQRVLALPDQAQRMDPDRAEDQLIRGSDGPGSDFSRVQGDPVVGQSNDFGLLLNTLFAQRAKLDREYRERGAKTRGNPGVPEEDTLEKLKALWERIFSEREVVIGDHLVQAKPKGAGATYAASALSDGERVGFYLIGHALLAPASARLVIDEPELHLHESIQSAIWDALEVARHDCVFVYITHDLAFAASRTRATKVVLRDYTPPTGSEDVGSWSWDIVEAPSSLPEDVVLRILGSRRPTLFVEGLIGSLDQEVFEALYPERYVIPSGGWESVDRSVRAFRAQAPLHHLDVSGIIDRDDRGDTEVAALQSKHIHVLPVATIENLLALPECIDAYMRLANVPESDRDARSADGKSRVRAAMKKLRETTIAERAQYAVRRRLGQVARKGSTKQDLVDAVSAASEAADPAGAFDEAVEAVDLALDAPPDAAFDAVLVVFRNKDILVQLASAFGTNRDDFSAVVVDAIRTEDTLRQMLRKRVTV